MRSELAKEGGPERRQLTLDGSPAGSTFNLVAVGRELFCTTPSCWWMFLYLKVFTSKVHFLFFVALVVVLFQYLLRDIAPLRHNLGRRTGI